MRENYTKNFLQILAFFSKIATFSLKITLKLIDILVGIFLTFLLTCVVYPQNFSDFVRFFSLIYHEYKFHILLFVVFLTFCSIVKQVEKKIKNE